MEGKSFQGRLILTKAYLESNNDLTKLERRAAWIILLPAFALAVLVIWGTW